MPQRARLARLARLSPSVPARVESYWSQRRAAAIRVLDECLGRIRPTPTSAAGTLQALQVGAESEMVRYLAARERVRLKLRAADVILERTDPVDGPSVSPASIRVVLRWPHHHAEAGVEVITGSSRDQEP